MIMVAMVDGKLLEIIPVEFPRTATTHPWIELERLFPVGLLALLPIPLCLGNNPIQSITIGRRPLL